jgi:hypothetical protein
LKAEVKQKKIKLLMIIICVGTDKSKPHINAQAKTNKTNKLENIT